MLTVPGQSACSCEQEIVRGGSSRTGYASAISRASVQAITVSVASGRYGPCCSWLPTGSTATGTSGSSRSEEHTSELQSRENLVCRLLLEKKKKPFHPA